MGDGRMKAWRGWKFNGVWFGWREFPREGWCQLL